MKHFPKFDDKLNSHLTGKKFQQSKTRPGTLMSYNSMMNTAVIVLDDRVTNQIGNIIKDVPCPAIQGVQTVAPTAGSRCLVAFTDDNERYPYIISYTDNSTSAGKHMSNYYVNTGIPKFLV